MRRSRNAGVAHCSFSVHLARTAKIRGLFLLSFIFTPFIPLVHEHAGHISAIVMVSLGLSGDLGAPDRTLLSSLISCLCADLPGPVALSLKQYCLSSAALTVSISLPSPGLWGALRSRVCELSLTPTPPHGSITNILCERIPAETHQHESR